MSKKILSVALALIFVISTFAVSAFAVGGAAFEEDAEAYTQAWRLEDLGETDGTYSVGVYLETNYKVGAIQFQIANDDGNAVLEGVDSEIFATPDFDVQWTEDGLVFIVPTPVDSSATAVDATTEILVATLSYTLKDGASSASLAIVDDAKSEANPGGSLIAVRMSDDNLVTGTMIYGQTATVEEGITIGAAAPADLAVKAAYASSGIIIDANKKLGGEEYAGVVYGLPLPTDASGKVGTTSLDAAYYTARFEATNGGTLTVKQTPYIKRPASYGTGTTLIVTGADGSTKTYVVVIFGDVNGDSKIDTSDVSEVLAASKVSETYADQVKRIACNVAIAARGMKAENHYNIGTDDLGSVLAASKVGNGKFVNGSKAPDQAELAASHNSYNTYYQ